MKPVRVTNSYKKALKRVAKRGCDLSKLEAVIEMLRADAPLPPRYRPHKLVGSLAPLWECHIEPDWLLVYFVTSDSVDLYDTGTHSDLFD